MRKLFISSQLSFLNLLQKNILQSPENRFPIPLLTSRRFSNEYWKTIKEYFGGDMAWIMMRADESFRITKESFVAFFFVFYDLLTNPFETPQPSAQALLCKNENLSEEKLH